MVTNSLPLHSPFAIRHSPMRPAYTLIELTIVVGLVAILAIGISSVVLMNTVTASRTRNLTHIRESGNYALGQLKQLIRNAKSLEVCDSDTNTLTIIGQDGGSTEVTLDLDINDVGRLASGSANYLTPSDVAISNLNVSCLPVDEPSLIKLSFSATLAGDTPARENPLLDFETSISLRND